MSLEGYGGLGGAKEKGCEIANQKVDRIVTYVYIQRMGKRRDIEPVKLPRQWEKSSAVKPLYEGSRIYVERGGVSFHHWINELEKAEISTIPLQFVPEYVRVSREAVAKRVKANGLTVFRFVFLENTKTLLGKVKARDSKKKVELVPKVECDRWIEILMERQEDESDEED
jgi:hypothetical protein